METGEWCASPRYRKLAFDNFASVTMKSVEESVPFEVGCHPEMLIINLFRVIRD